MYTGGTTCSTNSGDYSFFSGDSMTQTTEAHNGQYICLYGEDEVGNIATLLSAKPINIDTTAPKFIFTGYTPATNTITGNNYFNVW